RLRIEGLLKDLTKMWTAKARPDLTNLAEYDIIHGFDVIRTYTMTPISRLSPDLEPTLLPESISGSLPTMTLQQVMRGWSANRQMDLIHRAVKMVPNFHALGEIEKGQKM